MQWLYIQGSLNGTHFGEIKLDAKMCGKFEICSMVVLKGGR